MPASFGLDYDSYLPSLSVPASALLHGLLYAGLVAAIGGFILAHCKSPTIRALLFVLASLAMVSNWGSPADFLKQWATRAVFLAVVVFGVSRVARLNLFGYFLVLAIPQLILGSAELLSQPNGFYHAQGVACIVALGLLLIWPLTAWATAKGGGPAGYIAK